MVSPGLLRHAHGSHLAAGWEVALLLGMLAAAGTMVALLFLLNWIHRRQADRALRLEARVNGLVLEWLRRRPSPEEMAWLARLRDADRDVLFRCCVRALPGRDEDSRAGLRRALQRSGLLHGEIARLRHRDWARRADACRILGAFGYAAAAPALIERLEDPDAMVRQQAITALGELGAADGLDAIVDALDASGGWTNLLSLMALSKMGPASASRVGKLLAASNSSAKTKALLQITGQLGVAADPGLVRALARHEDPEVRVEAVRTLGSLAPDAESVDICLAAMDDPAWPTRALAARSLGSLGDRRAVPRLERAMGDPAYWVRHRAGEALARLSDAGREALERGLSDPNPFVRDMAAQAIFMSALPVTASV